jgi:hypothetical protein
MPGASTQSLVFLIDCLNSAKLVRGHPLLHSTCASPGLIRSSDFERLLECVCLRVLDNVVRLRMSRSLGIGTLSCLAMFKCSRDRALLEQKTVLIHNLCAVLPGAPLHNT